MPAPDLTPDEQKAYEKALERITACRRKRGSKLTLSRLNLTRLPPEIGRLANLRELDLTHNQLSALPPEIGQLASLKRLELLGNRLDALPAEIGWLGNLTELGLAVNQLSVLPREIGQLVMLRRLVLLRNPLGALPPEIGQLANLMALWLSRSYVSSLPPQIGRLTNLVLLAVSFSQLRTLPPEVSRLTHLSTLDLSHNKLGSVPPVIGHLDNLTQLFLHGNPELAIPDSILGPTYFEVVDSDSIVAARPQDILSFYFAQREGAAAGTLRPVNEIKVMLVGRGGAGKTSLRRFFMGQPHYGEEKETPGIALDSFRLYCAQGRINVRLWDFAGQEITHALHQFFLTEGCVYVLVLDPRSNTEMQDAEYWLGLLKRYAGQAPVLVALNRQDARQGGYDVDRRMLQERFPSIRSFTATNCDDRAGCAELRQRLCETIETLKETEPPHLKVPETWLKIMADCAGKARGTPQSTADNRLNSPSGADPTFPGNGRPYLTLDEFRQLCLAHGERDPRQQESLARLLHRLGAVLHFVDEPRLRNTAVLSPHWVTDCVYRLLRFKDRPGSDGTLTLAEALQALPGEQEKEARFLLWLMERFEMCFPLDEAEGGKPPTKWLIPGALGPFQPEGVTADWQKPDRVRLRYVYETLPEGVLPRFIVMTRLLSEAKPRWRQGVVLQDGQANALVRRGEKSNHVEVTAFGPEPERLRLLEIIQGTLARIHSDLPDPKPVAELELAGLPGIYRPVADLAAAELRRQKVAVGTPQGTALLAPTSQLNQASEPEARGEGRTPLNTFLSYSHEDKKSKAIFQLNLTVMTMKRLIAPWHDGLIEPGMRWREEIAENLERMDVFVGLLTTAFLASNFIQEVEIKAARRRLRDQGRDFLFVLILVDDISLEGLDLAEYQILKPGGKAVSKHKSRKEGFDIAQKELEKVLRGRQKLKRRQRLDGLLLQQLPTKVQ